MINLTIQGTDRAIQIVDIANNTLISSNTSDYNLIPYNNYLIRFGEIQTNISITTIQITQNKVIDDVLGIAMIILILFCIFMFFRYVKKL